MAALMLLEILLLLVLLSTVTYVTIVPCYYCEGVWRRIGGESTQEVSVFALWLMRKDGDDGSGLTTTNTFV